MSTPNGLPKSLTPHLCVLPSADLVDFLAGSGLPPLHVLLQSCSPLSNVTTRTTSLSSIHHPLFHVRFSDLSETEAAANEDQEERASRLIDWLSGRISANAAVWAPELDKLDDLQDTSPLSSPWWNDICTCVEGDLAPHPTEGWNHPVAGCLNRLSLSNTLTSSLPVVIAVSTLSANPLQSIDQLYARGLSFPSWIDKNILHYTLIIHPPSSQLSTEETNALLNAVKKQRGHATYLLNMHPSPDAPMITLTPPPSLPPAQAQELRGTTVESVSFAISNEDKAELDNFMRELVCMSLVPWLERSVLDWHELSSKRLHSRLFTTTKRLFATSSPSGTQHRTLTAGANAGVDSSDRIVTPQRRLAEFATFLGDVKLAATTWDGLRKESLYGTEMLPFFLTPSSSLSMYAAAALHTLNARESAAASQVLSLKYAIRWNLGIPDFDASVYDTNRWLMWAAGSSEEVPAAVLLAQAACVREQRLKSQGSGQRVAAVWYVSAADRLGKSGVKPLAAHFLLRARRLLLRSSPFELSPSFLDSEFMERGQSPAFSSILRHIDQSLGRIYYTSGNLSLAIKTLLGVFRDQSSVFPQNDHTGDNDLIHFVKDFVSAYEHYSATSGLTREKLELPVKFCIRSRMAIVLSEAEMVDNHQIWEEHSSTWDKYRQKHKLPEVDRSVVAEVGAPFYIRLELYNPLGVDISLTNVRLHVSDPSVKLESLAKVELAAGAEKTIRFEAVANQPCNCTVSRLSYEFLSLLPCRESLDQPSPADNNSSSEYVPFRITAKQNRLSLVTSISLSSQDVIAGESLSLRVRLQNHGGEPITRLWFLHSEGDVLHPHWTKSISEDLPRLSAFSSQLSSGDPLCNPTEISICEAFGVQTMPRGSSFDVEIDFHVPSREQHVIQLSFIYMGSSGELRYESIHHALNTEDGIGAALKAERMPGDDGRFCIDVELENASSRDLNITSVLVTSPMWEVLVDDGNRPKAHLSHIHAGQTLSLQLVVQSRRIGRSSREAHAIASQAARSLLLPDDTRSELPKSPLKVIATEAIYEDTNSPGARGWRTHGEPLMARRWWQDKRSNVASMVVGATSIQFPLTHPHDVDVFVTWSRVSTLQRGFSIITGLCLGTGHGELNESLAEFDRSQQRRNIFIQSHHEKRNVAETLKNSRWNAIDDPLLITWVVEPSTVHDFRSGPCIMPITVLLRNFSERFSLRFVLKMKRGSPADDTSMNDGSHCSLTNKRGIIAPLQTETVTLKRWIPCPGTFTLPNWEIEIETGSLDANSWVCDRRFKQNQTSYGTFDFTVVQR